LSFLCSQWCPGGRNEFSFFLDTARPAPGPTLRWWGAGWLGSWSLSSLSSLLHRHLRSHHHTSGPAVLRPGLRPNLDPACGWWGPGKSFQRFLPLGLRFYYHIVLFFLLIKSQAQRKVGTVDTIMLEGPVRSSFCP